MRFSPDSGDTKRDWLIREPRWTKPSLFHHSGSPDVGCLERRGHIKATELLFQCVIP